MDEEWTATGSRSKKQDRARLGLHFVEAEPFYHWQSVDVPHARFPEPQFTPGGTSASYRKGKRNSSPLPPPTCAYERKQW